MVLNDIEKLLKKIPEINNLATFYNDGIVFQTTFDKNKVNIPKLGNDLAEILSLFRNLQSPGNFKAYRKIVYDGVDASVIILKLGEQSNLALFFKREISDQVLQNAQIRVYIDKIQELIDIDRETLIKKEIIKKKEDLLELESQLGKKKIEKENLQTIIQEKDQIKKEITRGKKLEKEIKLLHQEETKIDEEIKKIEGKEIPKVKKKLKSKDKEIK